MCTTPREHTHGHTLPRVSFSLVSTVCVHAFNVHEAQGVIEARTQPEGGDAIRPGRRGEDHDGRGHRFRGITPYRASCSVIVTPVRTARTRSVAPAYSLSSTVDVKLREKVCVIRAIQDVRYRTLSAGKLCYACAALADLYPSPFNVPPSACYVTRALNQRWEGRHEACTPPPFLPQSLEK